MKACLVTGGAGFIGSHLVDALIGRGDKVVVLDDLSSGRRDYVNKEARFIQADIRDQALVDDIMQEGRFEQVYHLAAQIDVRKGVEDPRLDNAVNLIGSLNVFEASGKYDVKKVLFMSSGGALYDDLTSPAGEDYPVSPSSPYAIHKYAAERHLAFMSGIYGFEYCVMRPANVYGPRQYKGGEAGVISIFTYNQSEGKRSSLFGDGSKTRDYVYVLDLAEACLKAMDKGAGVFNIGTGIETSVNDLVRFIEEATGKPFAYDRLTDRPGEVRRSMLSSARAERELGWKPSTALREGIRNTIGWLDNKQNY